MHNLPCIVYRRGALRDIVSFYPSRKSRRLTGHTACIEEISYERVSRETTAAFNSAPAILVLLFVNGLCKFEVFFLRFVPIPMHALGRTQHRTFRYGNQSSFFVSGRDSSDGYKGGLISSLSILARAFAAQTAVLVRRGQYK